MIMTLTCGISKIKVIWLGTNMVNINFSINTLKSWQAHKISTSTAQWSTAGSSPVCPSLNNKDPTGTLNMLSNRRK